MPDKSHWTNSYRTLILVCNQVEGGVPLVQIHSDLIDARWLNEPANIRWENGILQFETRHKTDFWQNTWYGFRRDDGHFLGLDAPADFSSTVSFDGAYEELYDQAGIMIRIDEKNWIKAGIEFSDGVKNLSTVVTADGHSDWSMIPAPDLSGEQQIRLTRIKGAIFVHYLTKDNIWQLMRLCNFSGNSAKIGPMACSPERAGLNVKFSHFDINPPAENPLHG